MYKKILGLWFFLVLKVKSRAILIFKVIFLCQKSTESFWNFSLKNIKKGVQLLLLTYFHTLILNVLYFLKVSPIFHLQNQKDLEFFYTHQVGAEAKFIHPWTQLSSAVQVGSRYNICMYIQVWHVSNDRIQLGKEYHLFCAKSPRYFKSVSYIVYYTWQKPALLCFWLLFDCNNMYQNIWPKLVCSDMFGVGISPSLFGQ